MLRLIVTCEHGGNYIPAAYADLFEGKEDILHSHRGHDIGAMELYKVLEHIADKSFCATTSRLLVELNRSVNHKELFSEFTKPLPEPEKKRVLEQHYYPYREQVENLIHDFVMADRKVLHVAVHTFTPAMDGVERDGDIGLLYDPKRKSEASFCRSWKNMLQQQDKKLAVRFNYPYLGISDGFPTYLRRKFDDENYMGIELEVNQKFALGGEHRWQEIKQIIKTTLNQLLRQNRDYKPGEKAA